MIKAKELFELGVKTGIAHDPRGKKAVEKILKDKKEEYKKLDKKKQKYFDVEGLTNPYADTRHLAGKENAPIKKALVGIDCEVPELILAKELGCDTVIGHHPIGRSLLELDKVMDIQIDTFHEAGMPINIAEKSLMKRKDEIYKAIQPINVYREVQAAELLGLNYFNFHTAADNCVDSFLRKHIGDNANKKYTSLQEVVDRILEIPEFDEGMKRGDGPAIFCGDPKGRPGKIYVSMTGGTGPGDDIWEKCSHAGIGTVVEMHFSKASIEKAQKHHINLISSGHIPSDSLGMNILLDEFEKKGVKIVPASGLIRVKRKK